MDKAARKAMLAQWKERKPEMGIISFRCIETGENFLGASEDTKADFNSARERLNRGLHPVKRLQELWTQYGESGFDLAVVQKLEHKDDDTDYDYKEDLLTMRDLLLEETPDAAKILTASIRKDK